MQISLKKELFSTLQNESSYNFKESQKMTFIWENKDERVFCSLNELFVWDVSSNFLVVILLSVNKYFFLHIKGDVDLCEADGPKDLWKLVSMCCKPTKGPLAWHKASSCAFHSDKIFFQLGTTTQSVLVFRPWASKHLKQVCFFSDAASRTSPRGWCPVGGAAFLARFVGHFVGSGSTGAWGPGTADPGAIAEDGVWTVVAASIHHDLRRGESCLGACGFPHHAVPKELRSLFRLSHV